MKYIYIIYSDKGKVAYIGSTCDTLKKRLTYHKCDVKKTRFRISSREVLQFEDYKIDFIHEFENDIINDYNLLKIEHNLIDKYYYKNTYNNKNYKFKNNNYRIVNKRRPCTADRFICPCCQKLLTMRQIKYHLTKKPNLFIDINLRQLNKCININ